MATSYSPSELECWVDCPLKWQFRYDRKLRPINAVAAGPLVSGRAVHALVEHRVKAGIAATEQQALRALINAADRDAGLPLNDDPVSERHQDVGKKVSKYVAGVMRAVGKVPEWVWEEKSWHVEEPISGHLGGVDVHGIPDLWRVVEEEEFGYEIIELLDVKTTENNPMDYVLWTPQLRVYASMLSDLHDKTVVYRVLTLPTSAGKPSALSPQLVLTHIALARVEGQVCNVVGDMARSQEADAITPREGRHCNYCDFNDICKTRVMGGDVEGFIKENYYTRKQS